MGLTDHSRIASVYKQDLQNKSKLQVAEYQKFSLIAKLKKNTENH